MPNRRIIIEIEDDSINTHEALFYVSQVIAAGRISNHGKAKGMGYCFVSMFGDIGILAYKNKASDKFRVVKSEDRQEKE